LIDLLHGAGACLNGQFLRYALLKEGDRLRVGPYVLRVCYPDATAETPHPVLVAVPAETPVQPAEDAPESGQRPSHDQGDRRPAATEAPVLLSALQAETAQTHERQQDAEILRQQLADSQAECDRLRARVPELEDRAKAADHLWTRLRNMGAEMERLRVQLRAAASREAELESVRGECNRLREQGRALEVQIAGVADLQARLEAAETSARELDVVRSERDRWQAEAQGLQDRLPSDSADPEQLSRLAADLHAAQMERDRLQTEQQMSRQAAEQAQARLADLERALAEAATAHETVLEEARARWESERQVQPEAVAASVRELDVVRDERDRWQAEVQSLQAKLASNSAEQEEWRQRLEAAQQQLVGEREALRQQLADGQPDHVQLRARVAELEDRAKAADHLWTQLRDADAEMERLRTQLRVAESRQAELESVRGECDRLREQGRALEVQIADMVGLQARLEAAEASARELDAVRSERDRLQTEQQTSQQTSGQALTQIAGLERALAEAATAHETALEEARARWESERQALEARLALGHQTHEGTVQAAIRDVQAQAATEREEWRQRLEAAQQQLVWERRLFQFQNEQNRQQAASFQAERDRLAARLAQVALHLRTAERSSPNEAGHVVEVQQLRQQAARDQVFVQLSRNRPGHVLPQAGRPANLNVPIEQARPRAALGHEQAAVEEQRPLAAITQEVQVAWAGATVGQEVLPAINDPTDRAGEQVPEVGFDAGGEKPVEHQPTLAAPPAIAADEGEASVPSDTSHGSAASFEGGQPAEDVLSCLPQQTDGQPEARQGVWRQIFGFVLGK
jgi:hypothetical protein